MIERFLRKAQRSWRVAKSAWNLPPASGQLVVTDPHLDFLHAAVSDSLNFSSLRSKLWAADSGDLANGLKLFEEMLQKDATLYSVAGTRTGAMTGLDYEIVSAADVEDVEERALAEEAADFVRQTLTRVTTFESALEHQATAIGANLAVCEQVWDGAQLERFVPVPSRRLRMEPNEPGVIRVVTSDELKGIPAEGAKWVVHIPNSASGYPLTRSILRAQAFVYLAKMLAIADWIVFCEIFGMPIRIAKYAPAATREEKDELIEMMRNLGSKAFGVFSQAVTIEIVETSQRGSAPYRELIQWCDRKQTQIWLGGHLPADTTGGTGTYAAAVVQDEVREDLRDSDIKHEGDMVRRQIIAPLCIYEFWRDVPLPYFRRVKPEVVDRIQEATLLRQAQQTGMRIPAQWAYERLGIKEPESDDAVLEPPDAFEEGLVEG